MSLPIAFYLLVWVFTTPAKVDRQVVFTDRIDSKIECLSEAAEYGERAKEQKIPLAYSRFVCIPVPKG